jgi:hypothetical protein
MLVDQDNLTLAAVQSGSLKKTGYETRSGDNRVRIGSALYPKAVSTTREQNVASPWTPASREPCGPRLRKLIGR